MNGNHEWELKEWMREGSMIICIYLQWRGESVMASTGGKAPGKLEINFRKKQKQLDDAKLTFVTFYAIYAPANLFTSNNVKSTIHLLYFFFYDWRVFMSL